MADFAIFLVGHTQETTRTLSNLLRDTRYRSYTYPSPTKFLERHDPFIPGCAVLDLSSPKFDGLEVQEALLRRGGELPVIFLADDASVPMTVKAMRAGAIDVLLKPVGRSDLLGAIRRAESEDGASRHASAERHSIVALVQRLTPREREVMSYVIAGIQNKVTARKLGISVKTVKAHRGQIMDKMEASSLAQLVRMMTNAFPDPDQFVCSPSLEPARPVASTVVAH